MIFNITPGKYTHIHEVNHHELTACVEIVYRHFHGPIPDIHWVPSTMYPVLLSPGDTSPVRAINNWLSSLYRPPSIRTPDMLEMRAIIHNVYMAKRRAVYTNLAEVPIGTVLSLSAQTRLNYHLYCHYTNRVQQPTKILDVLNALDYITDSSFAAWWGEGAVILCRNPVKVVRESGVELPEFNWQLLFADGHELVLSTDSMGE